MARIKEVIAREILDSRGYPTIEVELTLESGKTGIASIPSGASKGSKEALELRDNDPKRYLGKGVLKAIQNVEEKIAPEIIGKEFSQLELDKCLLELDGTPFKTNLGANAILGVSLAYLKACASEKNKELYAYISSGKVSMPLCMMNILNGGVHAKNNLDIQEFMIVPMLKSVKERVRAGSEIFHTLEKILKEKKLSTSVGDEGGFAPNLAYNALALDLIVEAIQKSGYIPGKDVFLALDVAASEFYEKETKTYKFDQKHLSADELMKYYVMLVNQYPIISIEDPFEENDFESLAVLTKLLGQKILLVGDDYFVTNSEYLQYAIKHNCANAILLKLNQIGTVTEMMKTFSLAKKNGYKTIISHRSGETLDTFIADFAVGLSIGYIKTGSLCRGERIAKYNRLMKIEEDLQK